MKVFNKQDLFDLLATPFVTAYEGEGDVDSGGDAPSGNPAEGAHAPGTPDPTEDKGKRTFSQDEVNKIVQQRVGEMQKKIESLSQNFEKDRKELLTQLEDRERTATLTEDERKALQKRIEELRTESLSTEEAAKKQIKSLEDTLAETKRKAEEETKNWQNRYNQFRMTEELRAAALKNDARAPEQLVELLLRRTKVEQLADDTGQPTGEFVVKTAVEEFKEDGTPFTVECSPMEAVTRLKAQPERWGNQFNSQAQKGLDLMSDTGNAPKAKNAGLVLSKGFEAYKQSRQQNAEVLGIPSKR